MKRRKTALLLVPAAVALASGLLLFARAVTRAAEPGPLGRVRWSTDLAAAQAEARRSGRPLMVLSTGPASETARRFGATTLSHPIVIDSAREFVAVALSGDAAGEPAVRFRGGDGKELTPHDSTDDPARHSTPRLLARMVEALRASNRPVPPYLALVAAEYNPPPSKETASFAVGCYWKGEKELGALDGVLATRTGTLGREEVVEVEFDPRVLTFRDLSGHAAGMQCFRRVNAKSTEQQQAAADVVKAAGGNPAAQVVRTDAPADTSDPNNQQQYFLSLHPTYHFLPLTSLQATKVNAALSGKQGVERFLSPTQIELQRRMARLVEKDKRALYGIEQSLKPDRSPEGLPKYAAEIERRVRALE